ncbi:major facilitator superfamily domain-containing protein [Bisporella sp. PMI_857]|nr:major facilitator superfamily domain-containing protein [Bisporella sp. PMI_857]
MTPVSWASLPNKGQLAIITSVRVVDFFQIASLQACMYKHLESFGAGSTPNSISVQIGFLQGAFTATQVLSAIWWGRIADTAGRKPVLIIGLIGTSVSNIGVAFSKSYEAFLIWRIFAGSINGTVGAARAALAETVSRDYHPRAFLLLPLAFNIANTLGPILGASLVHPAERYPALFGQNSVFGGVGAVAWMLRYPYAAPNVLCAILLSLDALVVWLGLRETAPNRRPWQGYGLKGMRRRFGSLFGRRRGYSLLRNIGDSYRRYSDDGEDHVVASNRSVTEMAVKKPMPLRRVWNSSFLLALLTTAVLDLHLGGLSSLWPLFISSPHRNAKDPTTLPFYFTGGLGFQLSQVGLALSVLGVLGLVMQWILYPRVVAQYGLLYPFRLSMWLYPVAYFSTPYLSLLPFDSTGLIWLGILTVQTAQVIGRTFALPATILLLNYSCPHPSLLGSVHGIGSAISGASRTLGSIMAGTFNSIGLGNEMSGLAWWIFALVSLVGCLLSFTVEDNLDE